MNAARHPRRASLAALPLGLTALAAHAGEAPVVLDPVVVTSTRIETSAFDTPASVDVIDGEAMRDRQLQINLSESLGGVPGLQIQNRENYAQDLQVSIRGFGARSTFGVRGVRLYVDGIPATMPDGQGQTSNIDIGSIERVEVLRGPFSALYGNSSGGVVEVFTEPGRRPPSVEASVAAGSHGTWRYGAKASGATEDDGFDYLLDVTRFTTDGYRDHSAARKNLGNARLGWRPDDDSSVTLIVNSVEVRADDPLGLTREQFEADPRAAPLAEQYNTRKTVRQTQGGLVYERDVTREDTLRAMVYYGRRDMRQFLSIPPAAQTSPTHAGGVIDLGRRYGGVDLRWTARRELAGRPLTVIGGIAYDTMTEDRQGFENFRTVDGGQVLGVQGALRRDETNRVWNLDPYLQASWAFAERWTLDAGVRYSTVDFRSNDDYVAAGNADDSGDARYRRALPFGALRFEVNPDLNLYASVGRGFETPTLNEISYRPGGLPGLNFDLQPAMNTSAEVGAKARVAGGTLTAAVFHTRTRDEIVTFSSSGGRSTFQNAGRTRRDGAELQWSGRIAPQWRAHLAYTWLDAEYRDDACFPAACGQNPIRAGNKIPGIARQAAFAALDWEPGGGWRLGVEGRYLSRIYVDDANSDSAPSYFVAAASAGYGWEMGAWGFDAFARVDNLFDRKYAGSVIVNEGNGRYFEPAPGRTWSAGLSASYAF